MYAVSAPPATCLRVLPRAPAALRSQVALDAGCALVVFGPGRRVRLLPHPHPVYERGAQAAPGQTVRFQGRHVVWMRGGRVQWRSTRVFQPGKHAGAFTVISTATATNDGRHLAYGVSEWWGRPRREHVSLFIATPGSRELRIPTRQYPLGWTPRGLVTAKLGARRLTVRAWRADGRPASPARTLTTQSWTWDWSSNRLYTITGGQVLRSDGVEFTPLLRLAGFSSISPLGHGLLELSNVSQLVVFDGTGRVRTRASVPSGWRLDGALATDAGGAIAFEATTPSQHSYRLYAAFPGGGTRFLGAYSAQPSCAGHGLELRGSSVLVSTEDITRVYDARSSSAPIDLQPAVRWLKARHRTGRPQLL